MIMNVLNGIWSDIYILQTIIQKEKKKKNSISIGVSGCENKEKYPVYVSKKCWLWLIREYYINSIFLSKIWMHLYLSIYMFHITSWNKTFLSLMFTNIQYRKNVKKSLLDCFKINGKQRIQMLKNLNALNSKTLKEK